MRQTRAGPAIDEERPRARAARVCAACPRNCCDARRDLSHRSSIRVAAKAGSSLRKGRSTSYGFGLGQVSKGPQSLVGRTEVSQQLKVGSRQYFCGPQGSISRCGRRAALWPHACAPSWNGRAVGCAKSSHRRADSTLAIPRPLDIARNAKPPVVSRALLTAAPGQFLTVSFRGSDVAILISMEVLL